MRKYEFYLPPIRAWGPRWWSAYKMLVRWVFRTDVAGKQWNSLRNDVPWETVPEKS